ncbi:unnamed protein product [Dibothriocephalus latus]|uniref:Uncharacterized protein n=1 Tax=Dibothriocephalus latus TaxID=60516 RepID=A0A3P6T5D9_DIBLA|nr:unnamed protein product [Dibothriocephalus latus]
MEFEILPDEFYSQSKKFPSREVVLNNQQGTASTDCCTPGFTGHICFSNPQENTASNISEPRAFASLASASYPVDINLATFDGRRMRENRVFPQVLVNQPPQTPSAKTLRYPAHVIQIMEPSVASESDRKAAQSGAGQRQSRRRRFRRKWIQ